MRIKLLGAHNSESQNTRCMCLLVDGILAIDAGSLTSSLTFEEQFSLKAVLLTHSHYDHIRDIPAFAINLFLGQKSTEIYTHQAVFDTLTQNFLNSPVYAAFHKLPEGQPAVNFQLVQPSHPFQIGEYSILGIPVNHSVPTLGFQVKDSRGRSFFYSGDTGNNAASVWKSISPDVLFIEVTGCNRWLELMEKTGHLTPALLKKDLLTIKQLKGTLPRVIAVHLNPHDEAEIKSELAALSGELAIQIEPAYEGMVIDL
ncbi:MAG TPA: MBL fold metallo-hydrolase [Dehalococcoidales bacterium]|nr:MBL fold metallo-hydrolase [Dehalococcoidales bacterium]